MFLYICTGFILQPSRWEFPLLEIFCHDGIKWESDDVIFLHLSTEFRFEITRFYPFAVLFWKFPSLENFVNGFDTARVLLE